MLAGAAAQVLVDQVRGGPRYSLAILQGSFVDDHRVPFVFCTLLTVRRGDETGLAKVILGLEVFDLGGVGSIENSHGDRKHRISLDFD